MLQMQVDDVAQVTLAISSVSDTFAGRAGKPDRIKVTGMVGDQKVFVWMNKPQGLPEPLWKHFKDQGSMTARVKYTKDYQGTPELNVMGNNWSFGSSLESSNQEDLQYETPKGAVPGADVVAHVSAAFTEINAKLDMILDQLEIGVIEE